MTELKTAEYAWHGIFSLFRFALRYTAALKAYGEIFGDDGPENRFIEVAHETIWRQLMSELSKIFDAAGFGIFDNLSIKQLCKRCVNHAAFPDGEENELIKQMDELQDRYETLLSKNLRNKKLAHYDMFSIFTQQPEHPILFSQVEQFVLDTNAALIAVGERFFDGKFVSEYDELVEIFKENLSDIQNEQSKQAEVTHHDQL